MTKSPCSLIRGRREINSEFKGLPYCKWYRLHPLPLLDCQQNLLLKMDGKDGFLHLYCNQVTIEIYKSSPNDYYIYVPRVTFPTFVDNFTMSSGNSTEIS
ncbi:hypothetical protein TNIN_350011 [Trichonephila inaurata madagascariensis]|uniref:Uncharacterized protein n=1 Tax=Trichonephila inaurata madagascariensis TaxID=2747483 RepID=A0A8X6MF06_9ARAC|nr:hypothetical protein TNIN_350011 [Trichonephila inaurata madagascariensis]